MRSEDSYLFMEDLLDLIDNELIAVAELATLPYRKEFAWCVSVNCLFVFLYYVLHNTIILSQMHCFVNTRQ